MLIWFDVNTPKHALLFTSIGRRLSKEGHKYIMTAREYDATLNVFKRLQQDYILVGKYGGGTLLGKLKASVKKTLNIINFFEENQVNPDVVIHFSSPEAARIAFGLGKPSICINDSPHSHFALKLSLPFSNWLIVPKAIPKNCFSEYINTDRIVQFNGLDAVEWINAVKPDRRVIKQLSLEEKKFIIFRPEEGLASYYLDYSRGKAISIGIKILKYITKEFKDYTILILPRYKEHVEIIQENVRGNIVIPSEYPLGIDLYPYASLVITGGSTMAIEASLLGVPSITYFPEPLHVTSYLQFKGLPITHTARIDKILNRIKRILLDPDIYREDTKELLKNMEKPSDKLMQLIEET